MADLSSHNRYDAAHRALLLQVARMSIEHRLCEGELLPITLDDYPVGLGAWGATFVTIKKCGALRGCIGTLAACGPLVSEVARNACNAAFHDPRFAPMLAEELSAISVHLAVLAPPELLPYESDTQLQQLLRPGVDGLILRADRRQATFLPAVWSDLPDPQDFVQQLKRKAGITDDYPARHIRVLRYTTECWGET